MNNKFITFEGGEGAGKSTQIRELENYLKSKGEKVVVTREPGGTIGSEEIRTILKTGDIDKFSRETELFLFYAARKDLSEKLIRPYLNKGYWVLCDRYADSTKVYQGYAGQLDLEHINKVHEIANIEEPDITFVFQISYEDSLKRMKNRGDAEDRMESLGEDFHRRVSEGYNLLAESDKKRYIKIDAMQHKGDITNELIKHLNI